MEKTLVVYYSKSGNTRLVANRIKDMVNGDIYELQTKKTNTSDIGDMLRLYVDPIVPFQNVSKDFQVDIEAYDHIYIGTPVWGLTYSLPVKEFLCDNDFKGKKVSLFCTHDGGVGMTLSSMANKAKGADIVKKIDIISTKCRDSNSVNQVLSGWIK